MRFKSFIYYILVFLFAFVCLYFLMMLSKWISKGIDKVREKRKIGLKKNDIGENDEKNDEV